MPHHSSCYSHSIPIPTQGRDIPIPTLWLPQNVLNLCVPQAWLLPSWNYSWSCLFHFPLLNLASSNPPLSYLMLKGHPFTPSNSSLTPVEDDVLVSQAAVPHSTRQPSCLFSYHIQGHPKIPCPISMWKNIALFSFQLFLCTSHPHHPNRLWVETRDMTSQQKSTRLEVGTTGQPDLWSHCMEKTEAQKWKNTQFRYIDTQVSMLLPFFFL